MREVADKRDDTRAVKRRRARPVLVPMRRESPCSAARRRAWRRQSIPLLAADRRGVPRTWPAQLREESALRIAVRSSTRSVACSSGTAGPRPCVPTPGTTIPYQPACGSTEAEPSTRTAFGLDGPCLGFPLNSYDTDGHTKGHILVGFLARIRGRPWKTGDRRRGPMVGRAPSSPSAHASTRPIRLHRWPPLPGAGYDLAAWWAFHPEPGILVDRLALPGAGCAFSGMTRCPTEFRDRYRWR